MGSLIPIGYQKDIGFEYQYTSERGFEGWVLLQGSTTTLNLRRRGPQGRQPQLLQDDSAGLLPDARQKETISETTAMEEDDVVEKMFNIVRYKTRNNPPQGITIPANYEEYLAQFEARNLADYVATYQQSYAAMQAAN